MRLEWPMHPPQGTMAESHGESGWLQRARDSRPLDPLDISCQNQSHMILSTWEHWKMDWWNKDGDKKDPFISSSPVSISIPSSISHQLPSRKPARSVKQHFQEKKRKSSPLRYTLTFRAELPSSQLWHHLYSQDNCTSPFHLLYGYLRGCNCGGPVLICHSVWGLKLDFAAKLLQNRCWHKSGRFIKWAWLQGLGTSMADLEAHTLSAIDRSRTSWQVILMLIWKGSAAKYRF